MSYELAHVHKPLDVEGHVEAGGFGQFIVRVYVCGELVDRAVFNGPATAVASMSYTTEVISENPKLAARLWAQRSPDSGDWCGPWRVLQLPPALAEALGSKMFALHRDGVRIRCIQTPQELEE